MKTNSRLIYCFGINKFNLFCEYNRFLTYSIIFKDGSSRHKFKKFMVSLDIKFKFNYNQIDQFIFKIFDKANKLLDTKLKVRRTIRHF